jgi:hypothetical protein
MFFALCVYVFDASLVSFILYPASTFFFPVFCFLLCSFLSSAGFSQSVCPTAVSHIPADTFLIPSVTSPLPTTPFRIPSAASNLPVALCTTLFLGPVLSFYFPFRIYFVLFSIDFLLWFYFSLSVLFVYFQHHTSILWY